MKSDAVDGFVGKFGNKVFHLNSCPRTNGYASELIGKGLKLRKTITRTITRGTQTNRGGTQNSVSNGWNSTDNINEGTSEQEYEAQLLQPNYLATALKTGAPQFNYFVTAVWFKTGGNFSDYMPDTNSNLLLVTFNQQHNKGVKS